MADDFKKNIVKELENVRVWYFTINVTTKAHQSRLDIPSSFTRRCSFPSQRDCSLVTSTRAPDEWPVQFRTYGVTDPRTSAFSVGDGFSKFVEDNYIDLGTLLVLERVDFRCLAVTIYRRPDETERVPAPQPSPQTEMRPHFRKTLRACHVRPFKSTRLDIPTAFWRSLGEERFNGQWYTLGGPLQAVLVKSVVYRPAKQTFCFLTRGWVDFVAVNQLKLGDTLVFTQVGVAEFEVARV